MSSRRNIKKGPCTLGSSTGAFSGAKGLACQSSGRIANRADVARKRGFYNSMADAENGVNNHRGHESRYVMLVAMRTKKSYSPRTVARFTDAIAAHIAKGRLESEGIRVFIANEQHVWLNWLYSNALGGVEVQVMEEDEQKAREVLQQVREGFFAELESGDGDLVCPKCDSGDIEERKTSRKAAFLSLFFLQFPLPFSRNNHLCRKCGNKWQENE